MSLVRPANYGPALPEESGCGGACLSRIAAVALAFRDLGLRFAPLVCGERTTDIDHIFKLSGFTAAYEPPITLMRNDQFPLARALFRRAFGFRTFGSGFFDRHIAD